MSFDNYYVGYHIGYIFILSRLIWTHLENFDIIMEKMGKNDRYHMICFAAYNLQC